MATGKRGNHDDQPRATTPAGADTPSKQPGTAAQTRRRFGPLYLFRRAVLSDPQLQDRLRSAQSCGDVAAIANEYLSSNVRVAVSPALEPTPLREVAHSVGRNLFHVSEEDLREFLESNTNPEGEFLLGESELAMVAGGARVASTNECSYGSGCGSCGCSSSLACVCK